MREFRLIELLAPPSSEEMDRCFRGELDSAELLLFRMRLALHPRARRRFKRLERLGDRLKPRMHVTGDSRPARRSFWRAYALPASAFAVLVLVCWTFMQVLRPISVRKGEVPPTGWSLGQVSWGQVAAAYAAELKAVLRQVSQTLGPAGLSENTRGIPLGSTNTGLRAYQQPDGRTLLVVVRDTLVDGFMLDLSGDGARQAEHWNLDLWDAAQELVGDDGVQLARDYFRRQNVKHQEQAGTNDWAVYSPGYHAKLHSPIDVDGDGYPEYPVSLQGALFFLTADGQVRRSWATRQGLAGWIYDDLLAADLDSDGRKEIIASLAGAFYLPEYPQISQRAIAVYSTDGEELAAPLEWPNYVKLECVRDFTGDGGTELLISTDLPGNEGYEVTASYQGSPIALKGQNGALALIGFESVGPYVKWLPDPQVLDPEPQTVLQVLRPMGADHLRVLEYHHLEGERYAIFFDFDLASLRLTRLGELREVGIGVPFRQTVLVPKADGQLTLLAQPQELQLVDKSFRPAAQARSPGSEPSACPGVATVAEPDGPLLAFAWSQGQTAELLAYEIQDGGLTLIASTEFDRPVRLALPLAAQSDRLPLLILTDEAELWELAADTSASQR